GALGGLVTAFYMTRVLYLVFTGDYRGESHPHESPRVMTAPLVALAVPAALAGLVNLPFDFAHPYGFAAWTMFDPGYFEGHGAEFSLLLAAAATLLAVGGILAGRALYRRAPEHEPMLRMGLFSRVLVDKYYLDRLYNDVIVRPLRDRGAAALYWLDQHVIDDSVRRTGAGTARLGRVTYAYGDQKGIDGAINGLGVSTNWSGGLLKFAQSGNVQLYAGAMFVGVVVLAIAFAAA
ncbi:MAG: hypothetical protein M3253_04900, partial [Chloroflexota bacterium]|nr:hypothetical protein [Chloroflexota bacterium]